MNKIFEHCLRPTYNGIVKRMTDVHIKNWLNYGGRFPDVLVLCPFWRHSFDVYISQVKNRPLPDLHVLVDHHMNGTPLVKLSGDRTDNNQGYYKGNYRFVDGFVQAGNKRPHTPRLFFQKREDIVKVEYVPDNIDKIINILSAGNRKRGRKSRGGRKRVVT